MSLTRGVWDHKNTYFLNKYYRRKFKSTLGVKELQHGATGEEICLRIKEVVVTFAEGNEPRAGIIFDHFIRKPEVEMPEPRQVIDSIVDAIVHDREYVPQSTWTENLGDAITLLESLFRPPAIGRFREWRRAYRYGLPKQIHLLVDFIRSQLENAATGNKQYYYDCISSIFDGIDDEKSYARSVLQEIRGERTLQALCQLFYWEEEPNFPLSSERDVYFEKIAKVYERLWSYHRDNRRLGQIISSEYAKCIEVGFPHFSEDSLVLHKRIFLDKNSVG